MLLIIVIITILIVVFLDKHNALDRCGHYYLDTLLLLFGLCSALEDLVSEIYGYPIFK